MLFPFLTTKKRKQILVNKDFQLKYVSRIFWFTVGMIILGGIFSFLFISLIFIKTGLTGYVDEFWLLIKGIFLTMIVQIITAAVFIYWEGLYMTHKIVGPWVRIKKVLEEVGNGNFSLRINLRKADEFHDVASWINHMCDRLEQLKAEGKLCPEGKNKEKNNTEKS